MDRSKDRTIDLTGDKINDPLLSNAVLFNIIHLLLCLGFNFLYSSFNNYIPIIAVVAVLCEAALWFVAGFRYVLFADTRNLGNILLFILVSFLPMGILLGATYGLWTASSLENANYWPAVFFVSSPLLLWHRMGLALGYLLKGSIYYVVCLNVLLLFLCAFFGGLFARPQKKRRRRKRKLPSETMMLSDTMVLKKQDLGPVQHFPASDAETKVFKRGEINLDDDE